MRKTTAKEKLYKKIIGEGLYQRRMEWTKRAIASISAGSIVLDAGAGECKNKRYCAHLNYISQDFCQYEESSIDRKVPNENKKWNTNNIDIVSDITDIPVEDKSFDAVICTEVFEHLLSPELAVREFSRILKPGGVCLITAPANCGNHMMPYFYYNGISEFWYQEILKKYGFKINQLVKNGNYFDVVKERVLSARVVSEMYGKRMGITARAIGLLEGVVLNRYARKTTESENYICSEIMLIAQKNQGVKYDSR